MENINKRVESEYFGKNPPGTSFRADLLRDDILVEIEAVALVKSCNRPG
jgi:hypothetical protein